MRTCESIHPRPDGIPGLRELQDRMQVTGAGGSRPAPDPRADQLVLAALQVGLRETLDFLHTGTPTYEEFEAWALGKNGGAIDSTRLERLNSALRGESTFELESILAEPVLSPSDLAFWDEHGYVVVRDAVSKKACRETREAIFRHAGMTLEDPESWYRGDIWIPLAHHPALWANRNSARIHTAFAQIWGRADLWMNVDVCGVNPPMRPGYGFRGTPLHWDMTLAPPLQFGTQGILYLTDTSESEGAFSCVPGFHRKLEAWLKELPEGTAPRTAALATLTAVPIEGRAGDLIIWHHALPHAATPNHGSAPRVVQYLNMFSGCQTVNPEWL